MILENVRILSTCGLQGVFSDFGAFRNYYEFLEEYLKRYSDEIHANEYWGFAELYSNIHRKSFIITCYSYFEKELFTLCKNLKDLKSYSLDVTDLKGEGIDKAMKYLKKVGGIDISDDNKTWEEITNIRKIRNRIVHNNGMLDSSDKNNPETNAIRQYINRRSDMLSIKDDEILIYADYCRHVVNTLENFHREICLKE